MKRNLLLLTPALLLSFSVRTAQAQITITADDVQMLYSGATSFVSYLSESPTGLDALVDATGDNQTYDLSGLTYNVVDSYSEETFTLPGDYPGADFEGLEPAGFVTYWIGPPAEDATDSTEIWFYRAIDAEGLFNVGFVGAVETEPGAGQDTVITYYDPPLLEVPLPATYQDTWSESTTQYISAEGISLSTGTLSEEAIINGWGTLITPEGSVDCLRMDVTRTTGTLGGGTVVSRNITFVTKVGVAAVVSLDASDNPILAEYTVRGTGGGPTAVEPGDERPSRYALDQNYPNPFNPRTRIAYTLPEATPVRLAVYTLTGASVATLVDGVQPAGEHTVTFDGEGLASGLYLYRLETGDRTLHRLMALMK